MKDDGGPAFPRSIGHGTIIVAGIEHRVEVAPQAGMSLRDYFAGQALAGVTAGGIDTYDETLARRSYEIADAMLKERNK